MAWKLLRKQYTFGNQGLSSHFEETEVVRFFEFLVCWKKRLHCRKWTPIFRSFLRVSLLFLFPHPQCILHSDPTMQHTLSSSSALYVSRVVVVLFSQKIMVEQLVKVTSEYEERLRMYKYVPRFSFGRRMLRDDGAPNRFYLVYLFCEESIAIQFLKDIGLIRNKMQCKTCGRNMTSAHSTRSEGFRWRCRIHSSPPPPAWPRTVLIILRLGLLVLFFF